MKPKFKLAAFAGMALFAGGLLAGCGGGDSSTPTPPPPPPPSTQSFTAFVHMLLQESGTATPEAVNGVDFTFPDLDNPAAYCDVLPASTTGPCANGG